MSPAPSPASVEEAARELLAVEWDRIGRADLAKSIRKGRDDEWSKSGPAIRAITAALSSQSTLLAEVRAERDAWNDLVEQRGDRAVKAEADLAKMREALEKCRLFTHPRSDLRAEVDATLASIAPKDVGK